MNSANSAQVCVRPPVCQLASLTARIPETAVPVQTIWASPMPLITGCPHRDRMSPSRVIEMVERLTREVTPLAFSTSDGPSISCWRPYSGTVGNPGLVAFISFPFLTK